MIYRLSLLLIVFGLVSPLAAQHESSLKRWNFFLDLCDKYSPDGGEILNSLADDYESYADYAEGAKTPLELLIQSHTVVHEGCHGYNWIISGNKNTENGYYISPGVTIPVVAGPVFNSNELNRMVPDSLEEKIFRYGTYIGEEDNLSSQVDGLYGLLDEFSAYYHGAKFGYDMRPWYEKQFGYGDAKPWVEGYVYGIGSSITAFYEFRVFMAWYLKYARIHKPEVYRSLMANQNLRLACTLLYDQFKEISDSYEAEVEDVAANLKTKGLKVEISEKYLMVYDDKGSGHGQGHYMEETRYLEKLFTPELKTELGKFMIDGASISNYEAFYTEVKED